MSEQDRPEISVKMIGLEPIGCAMSEPMTREEIRDFVDLIYSWLGGSEVNGKTTHDIHLGAARQKCEQLMAALEAEKPLARGWVGAADLQGFGHSSYSMKIWTDKARTEQSGSLHVIILEEAAP